MTLDLAELTFIDSTGLHAIVDRANSANGDAPLVLRNVPPNVRRLFEITRLDRRTAIELRDGV